MPIRNDIDITWGLSPRVIVIRAPSTEVTMQDLHDTLRYLESQTDAIDDPKIVDSAGLENLGAGVKVGLTVTLQNALVQFEGRLVPLAEGTTSGGHSATELIDNQGTFITDDVKVGAFVANCDDRSFAEVLSINSEESITTTTLVAGITNEYAPGDPYKIWNVTTCSITGGNLVAVDEFGAELYPPILGSPFVQGTLSSSSSATFQEQEALQYASFGGGVTVDRNSTITGTDYPSGNQEFPVNNAVDAVAIAAHRGFDSIFFIGDYDLGLGDDVSGLKIFGQNPLLSNINIGPDAEASTCEISDTYVLGTLDGGAIIRECAISSLDYINGFIYNCKLFPGTVTLGAGNPAILMGCYSSNGAIIDAGGVTGPPIEAHNHSGILTLINKTSASPAEINFSAGTLVIDSTCTEGTITIRGDARVINELGVHMHSGLYNGNLTLNNYANNGEHSHDVWNRFALDRASPVRHTDTSIEFADTVIDVTNNLDGSFTEQRQ